MGRKPCCDKIGLKQGPWTAEEDKKLINFINLGNEYQCCWRDVPKHAGLLRCGKSCRLRWTNYLRPDLKRGFLSEAEEKLIIDLHSQLGNKWSKIASHMPGRTDNEIKNLWHTYIKKKLRVMVIDDPVTHKPLPSDPLTDQHQNHGDQEEEEEKVENDGISIFEDHLATEELIAMDTDNAFSIDEVPLLEPHEILFPDQSSCSSTFLSNIDSILEDFKLLPSLEESTTTSTYKENIAFVDNNNDFPIDEIFSHGFSIDEVTSSDPHEFVFLNFDAPSCSSTTINSVPEDLEFLPSFEDCPSEYHDGEIMFGLYNDDIADWDWLFNDFNVTKIN